LLIGISNRQKSFPVPIADAFRLGIVEELAKHRSHLSLNCLTTLADPATFGLASFQGSSLELYGRTRISHAASLAFLERYEDILLDGLSGPYCDILKAMNNSMTH
jgi:hypothetical protein